MRYQLFLDVHRHCLLSGKGQETLTIVSHWFSRSHANNEHRRAQICTVYYTDDYSGTMLVYFLKSKNDAVQTTEKFLADVSPHGEVKCIHSDTGTEFTGRDFQALLTKNRIIHETSVPYSPHQNGTAERGWWTLYHMGRCLLLVSYQISYETMLCRQ